MKLIRNHCSSKSKILVNPIKSGKFEIGHQIIFFQNCLLEILIAIKGVKMKVKIKTKNTQSISQRPPASVEVN